MSDWTPEQIATLRRMWMDGETPEAISATTGRTVGAIGEMRRRQELPARCVAPSATARWLPSGVVIHIGGIPYRYIGGGQVEGATPLSTALALLAGHGAGEAQ